MGRDMDLTSIVRDIVQFLERLREVKLPSVLEDLRNDLLGRSKTALVACAATGSGPSSSPEPYLSMSPGNGSAARGLLLLAVKDRQIWKEEDPQEYVGAEEPREEKKESHQDYYETFHEVQQSEEAPPELSVEQKRENIDTSLTEIYYSFSAAQTKSKCTKCGPLRKGGKKLFLFEQHRECWAGLVGTHLLIYGTEKDNRPYMVQSVRGYTVRAAPNAIPRDPKKSESTFELSSPGNKTLQFIARSPKDMEQWIANISRVNDENRDKDIVISNIFKSDELSVDLNKENVEQETYQDVGAPRINDSKEDNAITRGGLLSVVLRDEKINETETTDVDDKSKGKSPRKNDNPPPLPARIPRRLPSLPHESSVVASYWEGPGDDDDEDFYHKIDDFKDIAAYQNLPKKSFKKNKLIEGTLESYDDAQSITKSRKVEKETSSTMKEKRKPIEVKPVSVCPEPVEVSEDIYDDVASVLRVENKNEEKVKTSGKDEALELPSYDDVQNVSVKLGKDQRRKQEKSPEITEEPTKSPQKKSFLDRVRSGRRQQSLGKAEKKVKRKSPTPPPIVAQEEEIPVYDDVSNLPIPTPPETVPQAVELPEYNLPPPPRPLFTVPPSVPTIQVEEIYDDIGVVRRHAEEESLIKPIITTATNSSAYMNGNEVNSRIFPGMVEEIEHYQSPRSSQPVNEQPEELYDDIAILADFKARQRELANKKAEESKSASSSPEKRPWNRRFVSSRKSKCIESIGDLSSAETNGQRSSSEIEDLDTNPGEHNPKSIVRKNTFQKLINKMENSLGKTSSLASNKTNSTSDAT